MNGPSEENPDGSRPAHGRLLVLLPATDPPRDPGRPRVSCADALAEILEGLREGAYSLREDGRTRTHHRLVHDGRSTALEARLGGAAEVPMDVMVPVRGDGEDGFPVEEACEALLLSVAMDADALTALQSTMRAAACAATEGTSGGRNRVVQAASAWGPFGMVDVERLGDIREIDCAHVSHLVPSAVQATWTMYADGPALELAPFSATVWPQDDMDAMEALRVLTGADAVAYGTPDETEPRPTAGKESR